MKKALYIIVASFMITTNIYAEEVEETPSEVFKNSVVDTSSQYRVLQGTLEFDKDIEPNQNQPNQNQPNQNQPSTEPTVETTTQTVVTEPPRREEPKPNYNDFTNDDGFWVDKNSYIPPTVNPSPNYPSSSQSNNVDYPTASDNNTDIPKAPKIDINKIDNGTTWGIASKGERVQGAVTSNNLVSLANSYGEVKTNVLTFSDRILEFVPKQPKPLMTLSDKGVRAYEHPKLNINIILMLLLVSCGSFLCIYFLLTTYRLQVKRQSEQELEMNEGRFTSIEGVDKNEF